jgi:hypothetical protein
MATPYAVNPLESSAHARPTIPSLPANACTAYLAAADTENSPETDRFTDDLFA